MKRFFMLLFSAAFLVLAGCAGERTGQTDTTGKTEEETGLFSAFTATSLARDEIDQSIFEGKTLTMVNIWATSCSPCIGEMPDLAQLNRDYADQNVQVVGIVIDVLNRDGTVSKEQVQAANDIVASTGADYTHLLPSDDLIEAKLAEVSAVPTTVFVDETGAQVGEDYLGARPADKWSEIIDGLLEDLAK